ncbi:hypothetical protein CK203_047860 [Vitis vinifera]|uniref:Uncharacterized protein n=1 Tax=Vitis vinifera TaxID=29760 RepID=A0A438H8J5_VITVI|nr:hypothetical protein CK203_047860 [Vitis vinifera]
MNFQAYPEWCEGGGVKTHGMVLWLPCGLICLARAYCRLSSCCWFSSVSGQMFRCPMSVACLNSTTDPGTNITLLCITEIKWATWNDYGLARGTGKPQFIYCEENFAFGNSSRYLSKCKSYINI